MLSFLLAINTVWATPPRAASAENLRAACLRSDVNVNADTRRLICDCIAKTIETNRGLSDEDVSYLAKTWAEPSSKIQGGPPEADILEDYDEDVMESCRQKHSAKAKGQSRKKQK